MKKQIWLRPDQQELVVDSLLYVRARCDENNFHDTSLIGRFSKNYTVKRIDDVLRLLGEVPPQ